MRYLDPVPALAWSSARSELAHLVKATVSGATSVCDAARARLEGEFQGAVVGATGERLSVSSAAGRIVLIDASLSPKLIG